MAIRLIAMDLDGTALCSNSTFDAYTLNIFERASRAGIILVAATGRPLPALPACLFDTPQISYAITSNGTGVYHLPEKTRILGSLLSAQNMEALLPIIESLPNPIEVFANGGAFASSCYVADPVAYGAPRRAVSYVQSTRTPLDDMHSYILENRDCIEEMNLIFSDPEAKKRTRSILEQIPDLFVTSSAPHYLEFASASASKSGALSSLADYLHILPEEIMAFGDGENDLDMIRYSGTGIAMANAAKLLKEAADDITADNDHHGVADAILKYTDI